MQHYLHEEAEGKRDLDEGPCTVPASPTLQPHLLLIHAPSLVPRLHPLAGPRGVWWSGHETRLPRPGGRRGAHRDCMHVARTCPPRDPPRDPYGARAVHVLVGVARGSRDYTVQCYTVQCSLVHTEFKI